MAARRSAVREVEQLRTASRREAEEAGGAGVSLTILLCEQQPSPRLAHTLPVPRQYLASTSPVPSRYLT
eukprot:4107234-Lingulodinium_polyedra.AAC.1